MLDNYEPALGCPECGAVEDGFWRITHGATVKQGFYCFEDDGSEPVFDEVEVEGGVVAGYQCVACDARFAKPAFLTDRDITKLERRKAAFVALKALRETFGDDPSLAALEAKVRAK